MDEPTVTSPVVSVSPSPKLLTVFVVSIIVLLVIVFVGSAVYFLSNGPTSLVGKWIASNVPGELQEALLVTTEGDNPVYAYTEGVYSHVPGVGDAKSIVRDGTTVFGVVHTDGQYVLTENGARVAQAAMRIMQPSQDENTKTILFSQQIQNHDDGRTVGRHSYSSIMDVMSTNQWEVRALLPQKEDTKIIIGGYAPLMLNDTQFIFFTAGGVFRYNLVSGEVVQLLNEPAAFIAGPVLISPNRSLIAWGDTARKATVVYEITDTGMKEVFVASTILQSPALSDEGLYEVTRTKTSSEVWRYNYDGSTKKIYTFPRFMHVSRIVF